MSLEFRLIGIDKRSPYMIAAMDQAILEEVDAGRSPPTLVFHNWEKSVSIASGQTLEDLNLEECKRLGFEVVRVPSGGKAVVHYPDTEFSYSLFVPIKGKIDVHKVYETYCGRIGEALRSLGLPAVVVDRNDIFIGDRKIGGNAQRVKRSSSMQHGVILYDKPDVETMFKLMNPLLYPESAVSELQNLITGFTEYSNVSQEELRRGVAMKLTDGNYSQGFLTQRELEKYRELYPVYKDVKESGMRQVRGLCWLPAPSYKKKEVRVVA